ncbi:polycomb group protein Psc-like [Uloborus diversus]|uniref:polycomb group protein Psc-like n=1 Tax=Uloborus diversus TaxID=327109 RepID=UPI00240A377A|nr:polycomb group protein Psc-like [Uloborus diversus]
MLKSKRLKVTDLNPHLSCILCGGYFIDATTITECLHSFCRACIVRYLETSKYCPVCEVQVHKSRPLHYIRSDKMLQDIVYKLVPGLFDNEMKRRRELYASQPPEAIKESRDAEDRGECLDEKFIYAPDEIFSLSIEFGCEENQSVSSDDADDLAPKRRFLRCPAAVTIGHLKKFIRMKYGIPNAYEIDLRYDKESVLDEYTLMDVAYIFLWQRKGPMRFKYRIMERPPRVIETESRPIKQEIAEDDKIQGLNEVKPEVEKESSADIPMQQAPPEILPDVKKEDGASATDNGMDIVVEDPKREPKPKVEQELTEKSPNRQPPPEEKVGKKDTFEPPETVHVSSKKDSKSNVFKFPPSSLHKSSSSENKPAVMTVAPLTKTSASEPTSSTTSSTGTVTHGLYTGISIKKSPPNTLPPFRISSHLLPPRVPPLKLSPPRFSSGSKLEYCLRQMSPKETSSYKKSSSKKSRSSRSSLDKLESKVAQLKSASIKSVAPLVISVPSESKITERKAVPEPPLVEKKVEESASSKATVNETVTSEETKSTYDDDKMDLDNDLFEGPLVIAEPDVVSKEDSDSSNGKLPDIHSKENSKEEDPEDEEIDVVDDIEVDSGRGSDSSSRAEARSLCGDDDLGSPDSVPKTPELDRQPVVSLQNLCHLTSETKPVSAKCNGVSSRMSSSSTSPVINGGGDCGVLDLSKCSRKRVHEPDSPMQRSKPNVANPAVLDKNRQTTSCPKPDHPSFKDATTVLPHVNIFKSKSEPSPNFKCIIPPTNGNRQKIVIKNLGPSPNRLPDRFHHHHHNHNHHSHHHHHQRM